MERDIDLSDLKTFCGDLSPSEVRLADGVKYQEVISAVEIMDPRTDAMANHENIQYISDLMESGQIFTAEEIRSLTGQEIQSFMQHMIALEAQWLKGQYLPQTIFTTPYIHHMRFLQKNNFILYAYCLAVLKTVLIVFDTIAEADLKDNEEFLMYHFGLELYQDVGLDELYKLLDKSHADAMKKEWMGVANCITFQSTFLKGNLLLSKGHKFISQASKLLNESLAVLEKNGNEPMESHDSLKKLFHPMTVRWVPALTPIKWITSIRFHDEMYISRK